MLEGTIISHAAKLQVNISGEWSSKSVRDWRGLASATEPIVGVSFLRWDHHVQWSLSEKKETTSLEVRLLLLPYYKDNLDVQVNASIGEGGRRWRSIVESSDYRPVIPRTSSFLTGQIVLLARIEGNPSVDFLGIFLARRDAKTARNGIWHIRSQLRSTLPDFLAKVLTYGRTGEFDE